MILKADKEAQLRVGARFAKLYGGDDWENRPEMDGVGSVTGIDGTELEELLKRAERTAAHQYRRCTAIELNDLKSIAREAVFLVLEEELVLWRHRDASFNALVSNRVRSAIQQKWRAEINNFNCRPERYDYRRPPTNFESPGYVASWLKHSTRTIPGSKICLFRQYESLRLLAAPGKWCVTSQKGHHVLWFNPQAEQTGESRRFPGIRRDQTVVSRPRFQPYEPWPDLFDRWGYPARCRSAIVTPNLEHLEQLAALIGLNSIDQLAAWLLKLKSMPKVPRDPRDWGTEHSKQSLWSPSIDLWLDQIALGPQCTSAAQRGPFTYTYYALERPDVPRHLRYDRKRVFARDLAGFGMTPTGRMSDTSRHPRLKSGSVLGQYSVGHQDVVHGTKSRGGEVENSQIGRAGLDYQAETHDGSDISIGAQVQEGCSATDDGATPEERLAAKEIRQHMADAVSKLSPRQRNILRLHYSDDDMLQKDIAARLGVSLRTVTLELASAKKQILAHFAGIGVDRVTDPIVDRTLWMLFQRSRQLPADPKALRDGMRLTIRTFDPAIVFINHRPTCHAPARFFLTSWTGCGDPLHGSQTAAWNLLLQSDREIDETRREQLSRRYRPVQRSRPLPEPRNHATHFLAGGLGPHPPGLDSLPAITAAIADLHQHPTPGVVFAADPSFRECEPDERLVKNIKPIESFWDALTKRIQIRNHTLADHWMWSWWSYRPEIQKSKRKQKRLLPDRMPEALGVPYRSTCPRCSETIRTLEELSECRQKGACYWCVRERRAQAARAA